MTRIANLAERPERRDDALCPVHHGTMPNSQRSRGSTRNQVTWKARICRNVCLETEEINLGGLLLKSIGDSPYSWELV